MQTPPEQTPPEKVTVLYIAGTGRCGSTFLGQVLNQVEGCLHVGELDHIWRRCFQERNVCGCAQPFYDCDFWTAVFDKGFGGFDRIDLPLILRTQRELERMRALPLLLGAWGTPAQERRLRYYRQTLSVLYTAIRDVSGARVIVDGSKSPPYSYILQGIPALDLRVLHFVRDSRAVAFSHLRRKWDPAVATHRSYSRQVAPGRMAVIWDVINVLLHVSRARYPRYLRMRYEDAVRDLPAALERVWSLLDAPAPDFAFARAPRLRFRRNHTVAGNSDRFKPEADVRLDSEWQQKMNARDKALVTLLTLPLLRHCGYVGGRRSSVEGRRAGRRAAEVQSVRSD